MANANKPIGFRPVKHLNGSSFNGQGNMYFVAAGEANNIAIGDLVKLSGTADANGVAGVARISAAGDVYLGAVIGFKPYPSDLTKNYRPASTAYYVYVADSPDIVYEVQADAVVNVADVGLNFDPTVTAATVTGNTAVSNMQIAGATKAVTATLGFKLVGMAQREDNDITSTNAKWLVIPNRHQNANAVVGL